MFIRFLLAAFITLLMIVGLFSLADVHADQLGSAVELMMKTVMVTDTSIISMNTQTWASSAINSNLLISPLSKTRGKGGISRDKLVSVDSCFKMGRLNDVIISYAFLKYQSETSFPTNLGDEVAQTFFPNNIRLLPTGQTTAITYKDLMQHTTTVLDTNFDAAASTSIPLAQTLESWVDSYFFQAGVLNSNVFDSTKIIGTTASYRPARANTALLAYVLEKKIASLGTYSSLQDFIAQKVFNPLGMQSTFWLDGTTGKTPGVTPSPSFATGTFTSIDATLDSVYSQYYDGCIVDDTASLTRTLHPAWAADYMGYTTVGDVARLSHGIILDTSNTVLGSLMQQKLTMDSSTTSNLQQGQIGQGLGLTFYNGDVICAAATSTFVISSCPLSNQTAISGFTASSSTSQVSFFCAPSSTDSTSKVCVSIGLVATSVKTTFDAVFAVAATAFEESFGATTLAPVTTASPSGIIRTDTEEIEYSISVLFGSFLTFVGALIVTLLVQMLLLPPSMSAVTDTGGAAEVDIVRSPGATSGPGRNNPNHNQTTTFLGAD